MQERSWGSSPFFTFSMISALVSGIPSTSSNADGDGLGGSVAVSPLDSSLGTLFVEEHALNTWPPPSHT
jgi:hypothetical protein